MNKQALSEISKYCFEKKKTIEALVSMHYETHIRPDEFREVLKSQQILKMELIMALTGSYTKTAGVSSRGQTVSCIDIIKLDQDIAKFVRCRHEVTSIFKKLLKKMSIGKNQLFKNLEAINKFQKTVEVSQILTEFLNTGCPLISNEKETILNLYDYED